MLYRNYTATNSSIAVVCTSMFSLSREHSKAQHSTSQSPLHKAASQVRADQSTYQKNYVRTYMLRPVCFPGAWSSWHLQVACLHLNCWTIYFTTSVCYSNAFFLVSERSGWNRPLHEAPCICTCTWPFQAKSRYDARLANLRVPGVCFGLGCVCT